MTLNMQAMMSYMDIKVLAKRGIILFLDLLAILVICLVLTIGFTDTAFAYVDPSVMTYTIQALAGVAVALSAVIGVAWRRLRKFVYKKLNIDENAGKLVEGNVHAVDPSTDAGRTEIKEANELAKSSLLLIDSDRQQNKKWLPRFILSFFACLFLVYTIGIVAPFEMVSQNSDSLSFGINTIAQPLIIFAIICILILSLIISALRGRAFNVAVGIIVAIGLCCYIQATFMNSGMPSADGSAVPWEDYTTITFVTGLAWLFIVAFAIVLAIKNGSLLKTSAAIVSIVLVLIQSIGLMTIFTDPVMREDGTSALEAQPYATSEGLFEVGSSNNVVMFILDMFDNDYLDSVFESDPSVLDDFTGFTWYQDTSGYMIPTAFGLTCILTGQQLDDSDDSFGVYKLREWYGEHNLLDQMNEQGYSVDLYTTETYRGLSAIPWKWNNVNESTYVASIPVAVSELWRCALYRDMPWILKPLFWFYTGTLNTAISNEGKSDDPSKSPYVADDVAYYEQLTDEGLNVDDSRSGENGSFKLIHLDGSHFPYNMTKDIKRVGDYEVTVEEQSEGALRIVEEYINQLKKLGVYDETTIIVTADHGKWYPVDHIPEPSSPILLIKPAHQGEAQNAPMTISTAQISQEDLPSTLMDIMGGDPSSIGSGMSILDATNEERERFYNATCVVVGDTIDYVAIEEWKIDGDVQDWNSWSLTGRQWPIVED